MKKLKLNLDELKVESFNIDNPVLRKGTVKGNVTYHTDPCKCPDTETDPPTGFSCPNTCYEYTCEEYTCYATNCGEASCVYTCGPTDSGHTCANTCDVRNTHCA